MRPKLLSVLAALILLALAALWLVIRASPRPVSQVAEATIVSDGVPRAVPSSILAVELPDSTTRETALPAATPPTPPRVVARNAAVVSVHGRVVDDLNAPVKRFSITSMTAKYFRSMSASLATEALARAADRRSFDADDGSFELTGLADGERTLLATTEDGGRSNPLTIKLPVTGGPVKIVVPRATTVSGTVVDNNRRAVADAVVYIWVPGDPQPSTSCAHPMAHGATSRSLSSPTGASR
jgi:hypothetical protein